MIVIEPRRETGGPVTGPPEVLLALPSPAGKAKLRRSRIREAARWAGCLPLLMASLAMAQGTVDTDIERHGVHRHVVIDKPYKLQASALRSGMLPAPAAERHGIDVAADRGVLNVVVLKEQDGKQVTVPAEVTAIAINLLRETEPIEMREVKENDHVSYIGSFGFQPLRNLRFVINALPQGAIEPIALEFEDRFVVPK
jgi:hypothetical protein